MFSENCFGEQTVHEKWDQNVAILSGDTMVIKSYQKIIFSMLTISQEFLMKEKILKEKN